MAADRAEGVSARPDSPVNQTPRPQGRGNRRRTMTKSEVFAAQRGRAITRITYHPVSIWFMLPAHRMIRTAWPDRRMAGTSASRIRFANPGNIARGDAEAE